MEVFFKGINSMVIKLVLTAILIYFNAIFISAQIPLQIKNAASEVFLKLHQDKSFPAIEFESLKSLLNSEVSDGNFENEYAVTKADYDNLKSSLILYEELSKNISNDSSLYHFNQWYLQFNNTFYNYLKEKFLNTTNKKILFLSTSISCHCTLEMCKNQLIQILDLVSRKGGCPCSGKRARIDKNDLLVVDAYTKDELQTKYEILFLPAVIVLGENNQVLHKIEYKENMIDKLNYFLRGEI